MKSELFASVVTAVALAGGGAVASSVVRPVEQAWREREGVLCRASSREDQSSGAGWGLLGGYRSLAADVLWVQLHATWERRDWRRTDALVRTVTAADPRPVYFWQNGARMIAYDFAAWRIEAAGGYAAVSHEMQQQVVREQARDALRYLDAALALHRDTAELWVERANIEYGRLRDFAAAAESYRRAAETQNAPAYAARLHGEMLRRLGRKAEALAWLTRLHPTLPVDDEAAAADLVLARIRELERELGVTVEKAYRSREE